MDLLKIYDFGVKFLNEHPKLAEWHKQLKKSIVQSYKKENLSRLCQERHQNKSDDAIKCSIAVQFCLALLFLFFGCNQLIFHFSLFWFAFDLIIAFAFYLFGTLNTESLKYTKSSAVEQTVEVKPVEIKPAEVKLDNPKKTEKEEKKEKTLFWRIYGYVNTLSLWGFLYLYLVYPDTLKKWLQEYHISDYLPHEAGVDDEKGYLALGIIVLAIFFAVLKCVLMVLFFIFQKLFPKRDIREL